MQARERQIKRMVEAAGLTIADAGLTGNGRFDLQVEAPNGQRQRFILKLHCGDVRQERNEQAELRRFAEANPRTTIAAALENAKPLKPPATSHIGTLRPMTHINTAAIFATTPAPTPAPTAQPQRTEQPMTQQAKPAKQNLTHKDFFRLCDWLRSTYANGAQKMISEVAAEASKALGAPVSAHAINNAMEATGVQLVSPQAKSSEHSTKYAIVASALIQLMEKIGEPVPDDLRALVK